MKNKLILMLAVVLCLSFVATAEAGKGCGTGKESTKHACGARRTQAQSADKESHTCPDVKGKAELMSFHQAMHPVHVALQEKKFDEVCTLMPALAEASEALSRYDCDMGKKCTPKCKEGFLSKRTTLQQLVETLKEACGQKDNDRIAELFDKMHTAYIEFASHCDHSEERASK